MKAKCPQCQAAVRVAFGEPFPEPHPGGEAGPGVMALVSFHATCGHSEAIREAIKDGRIRPPKGRAG